MSDIVERAKVVWAELVDEIARLRAQAATPAASASEPVASVCAVGTWTAIEPRNAYRPKVGDLLYAASTSIAPNWQPVPQRACVKPTHEAADAFWKYWKENGETHRHGYYESTWGAINAALAHGWNHQSVAPQDERAAFERWWLSQFEFGSLWKDACWAVWQARAALSPDSVGK